MNRALILEAIVELKRRKLRTGLTLLGMVFGVAAIVAMLAVGEGSKREALRLVAELGLNNIFCNRCRYCDNNMIAIKFTCIRGDFNTC